MITQSRVVLFALLGVITVLVGRQAARASDDCISSRDLGIKFSIVEEGPDLAIIEFTYRRKPGGTSTPELIAVYASYWTGSSLQLKFTVLMNGESVHKFYRNSFEMSPSVLGEMYAEVIYRPQDSAEVRVARSSLSKLLLQNGISRFELCNASD